MNSYRVENMDNKKSIKLNTYYLKTLQSLKENPPKNFWTRVFFSGVEEAAFNLVAIFFIIIISLLISSIIPIKIISIITYIMCICTGLTIGGINKIFRIYNTIDQLISYRPDQHDKHLGIYFHLARYYHLFRMRDFLNEYRNFLKHKEYYEGEN